ncbi:unnamed protein product [Phytophthora fragariaefolia]|uniref:Unnamed protein product n=1 Tax=Phytophthora fragariaefolia TaxID=1490495 RepID=A0A9W6YGQ8_9STRA|nr:unnamed protein product [Phytophthora fragariaefolia]
MSTVCHAAVGDGEDPHDPNTSPVGRQGSAVCNRVAFVQGTVKTQGADAAAARAGRGGSVRASPTQSVVAGSALVEKCAGVVARANRSGRVGTPTPQGVVAGSARATEGAEACARAATTGRAGAPTCRVNKGDKVTSTPKEEASSRDADSAAEDRVLQVFDVFTGEPKVGEVLTPLPTVAELLELEELSCVEVLDSLKTGELAEVVLLCTEGSSLELNSSSVMGLGQRDLRRLCIPLRSNCGRSLQPDVGRPKAELKLILPSLQLFTSNCLGPISEGCLRWIRLRFEPHRSEQ